MKYSSLVFAAGVALAGIAGAVDENTAGDDRYVENMVECISDFIASELDDVMKDEFVTECMREKVARKEQPADRKS